MTTETDHVSPETEPGRSNRWSGYAYPAQNEPPEEHSGDPAAEAEIETEPEAEAVVEAEPEAVVETEPEAEAAIETEPEAAVEAEPEAVVVASPELEAETDEQTGVVETPSTEEVLQETAAAPVGLRSGAGPLLTAEAENDLLSRWTEIQISFVEDPLGSVQNADALIAQIGAALQASFEARRIELSGGWQSGQPDTEELRLALREYRSFMGTILQS